MEDLRQICIPRSKIELWADEPFRDATLKSCLVRVGFNKKYFIAQIKKIVEEEDKESIYRMTNGKLTSLYLYLLITEDKQDKIKPFKII